MNKTKYLSIVKDLNYVRCIIQEIYNGRRSIKDLGPSIEKCDRVLGDITAIILEMSAE
jgi:hypothetical protein